MLDASIIRKDTQVPRDPTDLRDRLYRPSLRPLDPYLHPPRSLLDRLRSSGHRCFPRHQGSSPTCAGQALAALIDIETLRSDPGQARAASARMLYEMARDIEAGEGGGGVTLRSVVKGFYHHGVCSDELWPFDEGDPKGPLTPARAKEARGVSLGAYYRLEPTLNDYHAALNEVGEILASASLHDGWVGELPEEEADGPGAPIPCRAIPPKLTTDHLPADYGHAFVIVGYTKRGFIVLNSWGDWGGWNGARGLALWRYEDWAITVRDAWVLRLGVPAPEAFEFNVGQQGLHWLGPVAAAGSAPARQLVGHYAHLDDGAFVERGRYPSDITSVQRTRAHLESDDSKSYRGVHLTLSGALLDLKSAVPPAIAMKHPVKAEGYYPYTVFWCVEAVEQLFAMLAASCRKAKDRAGSASPRMDRLVEDLARGAGRAFWREIETNAAAAASREADGGLARILDEFLKLDGRALRIVTLSEGALLLARWADMFPAAPARGKAAPARRRFFDRLLSVDVVAPPMTPAAFDEAFRPFIAGMRDAEAADGRARAFRLHSPAAGVCSRLRVGDYGGSYLDLVARSFMKLAEGERLVGDWAPKGWREGEGPPGLAFEWITAGLEEDTRKAGGPVTQQELVHGAGMHTRLVELLRRDVRQEES